MMTDATNDSDVCVGIYRDGLKLVASLNGARFPNRCVKTNRPANGPKFKFRERITSDKARQMSNYAAATAKGVAHAIGAAAAPILVLGVAAILATVQSVELDIGLSEELQLRFRRRRSFATRLTFTGLFFTFGLPVAYLLVFEEPRQLVMQIALGASAIIGLITMIVGLLYYAIAVPPTMKILTTDGKHVWFDGVHPDFLAKLPNFPRD